MSKWPSVTRRSSAGLLWTILYVLFIGVVGCVAAPTQTRWKPQANEMLDRRFYDFGLSRNDIFSNYLPRKNRDW